jgi:serine/threonine protein kinase
VLSCPCPTCPLHYCFACRTKAVVAAHRTKGNPPRPLQVKLCDFGLAMYSSGSITKTSTTTTASSARTLEYSSPERLLRGRRSRQDDVYAFGIVMYVIASSLSPYIGIDSADVERVVKNGARPEIEQWEQEQGAVHSSRRMQRVVTPYCELARQCWSEKPAERPAFDAIYARLAALAAIK